METGSLTRAGVSRDDLDGTTTWVLTHPDGARLEVAEAGATLLRWQVPGPDGALTDLHDGYRSAAELKERDGYRGAVLVPWSNRVRDARYTFAGTAHDLGPAPGGTREALHGLLTAVPWRRAAAEVTDSELTLRMTASIRPDDVPGYPFALDVSARYSLGVGSEGEARLGLELTVVNVGDEAAPVTLGWHPYLRLPGHETVDDVSLTVPARARVLTDRTSIPLRGEQAYAGVASPVVFDTLAGAVLDDAFTHLVPDDDGVVATVLRSPVTGDSITVEQEPFEAQVVHVFTGDPLVRDPRGSVAIEPCRLVTDAFNRAETADALPLPPGERRSLVSDVVYRRG